MECTLRNNPNPEKLAPDQFMMCLTCDDPCSIKMHITRVINLQNEAKGKFQEDWEGSRTVSLEDVLRKNYLEMNKTPQILSKFSEDDELDKEALTPLLYHHIALLTSVIFVMASQVHHSRTLLATLTTRVALLERDAQNGESNASNE